MRSKFLLSRLRRWYYWFFSIEEIEQSQALRWLSGALLFGFFLRFRIGGFESTDPLLITREAAERLLHTCWPYFTSCGEWYFLSGFPYGYSLAAFYMLLFGIMALAVVMMGKQNWVVAHGLLGLLFLWKISLTFFLSRSFATNFDYYHIVLTFFLLAVPAKLFFLRIVFVLLYFFSATVKFHEGWVLGTYFSALRSGLPFVPDVLIPLATNTLVAWEMGGSWFLLSRNRVLQRTVCGVFTAFHLYSGVLVGYTYPAIVLPPLLILFGPLVPDAIVPKLPWSRQALVGWICVMLLFVGPFAHLFIRGDVKLTLEGNLFGLSMFEANHQCGYRAMVQYRDGTTRTINYENARSSVRCDPYLAWFYLQGVCARERANLSRISWTFDHSINGGPFYRIVDEENACVLEYRAIRHNPWIRLPEEGAPIQGYPVKNYF